MNYMDLYILQLMPINFTRTIVKVTLLELGPMSEQYSDLDLTRTFSQT